ncbi:Phage integrase family protein [uncultured Desulfobacterium sp.]|uniref:Phage integrase family protein n=1 Tax=uncultured Desulfobacterium sp. TaxID=201089 RepID=A0A445MWB5_9BACT|nr:Phage integrase family protein [uncultured Desulfobacterium sp.]
MPAQKRFKTKYPGVYFIEGKAIGSSKAEKIFYVMYRRDGKQIHEKAGRQFQDDMTPARAAQLRTLRLKGDQLSNKARREAEKAKKEELANKFTINRLWEKYVVNSPGLKGIVTDKNRYENHIKPALGDKEPKEILPLDIDRIRLKLLKKKKSGTVKNVLELIRRIINFGVKKNLCEGLSFRIEMPKVNNLKTEDLNPDQLTKLLAAIDEDSNIQAAHLMRMVLYTGMRRTELFKLKWTDIDFDRGFILIRDPKGGPDQKIPLNDAARSLLESHPKYPNSLFVFPGRGGRQRIDINHQVGRIKKAAGLPDDFRALHGLRHVYASMLASSGNVDMYTLQKLLTHKSPLMTQRYAHLRDETLKRASDLAGDIINNAANGSNNEKVVNLTGEEA